MTTETETPATGPAPTALEWMKNNLAERFPQFDTSTVSAARLAYRAPVKLAPSYHLQTSFGNACYMNPPGHPAYFTRSIYTMHGNSPARGAQMELFGAIVQTDKTPYDKIAGILDSLYLPIPEDSARVQAWEAHVYQHLARGYYNPAEPGYGQSVGNAYYWPCKPGDILADKFGFKTFRDDPRFSEEWRTAQLADVAEANAKAQEFAESFCTPENHAAVLYIRKYYPNHAPRVDWISAPPKMAPNWYARLAERPTPETCPGDSFQAHPVNGAWCQVCGWSEEAAK